MIGEILDNHNQVESCFGQEEIDAVVQTIKSGWITEGKKTEEFEHLFSEYTGIKHCIAVSNWTDGLILAIETLKSTYKIESIIVPNLTFVASLNSCIFCNVKPYLVDVDYRFQLDANMCEDLIKKNKIDAIMLVDLYGSCPNMDDFQWISDHYGVKIIEDAAQALGVTYKDKHVGCYIENSIGGFSLYGNKIITSGGEGGMLVTNNDKFAKIARALKSHGSFDRGTFVHEMVGFNFRIDDIRSAFGIEQLKKLNRIIEKKKAIYEFYSSFITMQEINKHVKSNYWFCNVQVCTDIEALKRDMEIKGIQTRRIFKPLNEQPCYAEKHISYETKYRMSQSIYNNYISLPSHYGLSQEDLDIVGGYLNNKRNQQAMIYWS